MKRSYLAENPYGVRTGFANTWGVLVFVNDAAASLYEEQHPGTCKRIKRTEVTSYASNWDCRLNRMVEPRPFTGEYWGIDPATDEEAAMGMVGRIGIERDPNRPWSMERFYK